MRKLEYFRNDSRKQVSLIVKDMILSLPRKKNCLLHDTLHDTL